MDRNNAQPRQYLEVVWILRSDPACFSRLDHCACQWVLAEFLANSGQPEDFSLGTPIHVRPPKR